MSLEPRKPENPRTDPLTPCPHRGVIFRIPLRDVGRSASSKTIEARLRSEEEGAVQGRWPSRVVFVGDNVPRTPLFRALKIFKSLSETVRKRLKRASLSSTSRCRRAVWAPSPQPRCCAWPVARPGSTSRAQNGAQSCFCWGDGLKSVEISENRLRKGAK